MFLLNDRTHRMVVRHHPTIGHLWVPNQRARIPHERGAYTVRTNAQGFRSDWDFETARGERPRILVFGDSMTAGDGCDNGERYAEQVGEILGAEVFNYAVSGTGTDQHLLILRELAREVEADLVVLGVYVENVERIQAAARVTTDRATGERVLVAKPYFELSASGELELRNHPVPRPRPPAGESLEDPGTAGRRNNPLLAPVYRLVDALSSDRRLARLGRVFSPRTVHDYNAVRSALLKLARFDPFPAYRDPGSRGARLMTAILEEIARISPVPVVVVPILTRYHLLDGLAPTYRRLFARLERAGGSLSVLDPTEDLLRLDRASRERLTFDVDPHLSPFGHRTLAEHVARHVEERGLLPERSDRERAPAVATRSPRTRRVLGISCFYHDSAASLVEDGRIVAAAQEERFTRVKNDRGFPSLAVNYCLEEGGVDAQELDAIVFYDNSALTFERLLHTVAALGDGGADLWQRMLPPWLCYKLRVPDVIRKLLGYEGRILQNRHHRSHAASAFFPSPFERAAILTVDGVGEWATASIAVGRGSELEMLREMHFPHSLGLLYSAFTEFTGFQVNNGEYRMMGLAPYGEPRYESLILDQLVDLKADGSIELDLDYFDFLSGPSMTNERFARLFGGPKRAAGAKITRREMDLASSVQKVTETAMLRMAAEVRRLTGETNLCLAGGVALNCVANGRLLREGPFEQIWLQPAAGDAGASLGAALDVSHQKLGVPRVRAEEGSDQRGSTLGPGYSAEEIAAFLDTFGYPYQRLEPGERAGAVARAIAGGKVVGHFSGRGEFGPRALGSRSILGDPRDRDMQVNLNLKIKYRESFRPFAPSVLAERASEYFELATDSPYMLIVAGVQEAQRLPAEPPSDDDPLAAVKIPRSRIPAVTHVDYSARVQTVRRRDHPEYSAVIEAFDRLTGCPVIVNTSFNVRGEPIVNTPEDAFRCFMRTEMDVLILGDFLLRKEEQTPWPGEKGHLEDFSSEDSRIGRVGFRKALAAALASRFLPIAGELGRSITARGDRASTWIPSRGSGDPDFAYPVADSPRERARAILAQWEKTEAPERFLPLLTLLLELAERVASPDELVERVSRQSYIMF